jgi:tol-pal system protein YbgF
VESEVQRLADESAQNDSRQVVQLDRIIALLDSLVMEQRRIAAVYGDMRGDMTEVQRQLLQIQELTGQSQARLSELRSQIEGRQRPRPGPPRERAPGQVPVSPQPQPAQPQPVPVGPTLTAQELYDLSLQQLRRGSPETARAGFGKLLSDHPNHTLAGDAQYLIGESWDQTNPDSAKAAYDEVVEQYPDSRRAPAALYKLGLIAERGGDLEAARLYYLRVVSGYPRSDEAELARAKLSSPGEDSSEG